MGGGVPRALDGTPVQVAPKKAAAGTLRWLWDRYRETTEWSNLALGTRWKRENIMHHVLERSGALRGVDIARKHIVAGRDSRKDTPAQARHFIDTMRGLFCWALDAELIKKNPTDGVKRPAMLKGSGYAPWTEEDLDRYESRWPVGTKERVWLATLLYTGFRIGDAVRLGRPHVRGGMATILTEKTKIKVSIPNSFRPAENPRHRPDE
jgi:integrase